MKKTVRLWFVIDLICVILFALGIILFATVGKPYKRGFFCNDESITKPYKDSTVPSAMAVAVALVVSVIVITVNELVLKHHGRGGYSSSGSEEPFKCFSYDIPKVITTIIWFLYADVYGAALNTFVTDVGKYSLGRLRPHFLDACKPAWGTFNCTDEKGNYVFVNEDVCTAAASKITKQMRLSFPSGHASFSAYTMIFLVLYIESRVHFPKESKFLKILVQAVFVMLALFTGFSRVSDYKHHWSDVLAGFFIGTFIAVIVALKVLRLKFHGVEREERTNDSQEISNAAKGGMSEYQDVESA